MKSLSKVVLASLVALILAVSIPDVANAAVTYTDGTYACKSEGETMSYILNVVVTDGVITEAKMQLFYGTVELTEEMAETQPSVKTMLDSYKTMCDELVSTNDGALVTSADDAFKACIDVFIEQAVSTEATESADASETDAVASEDTSSTDTAVDTTVETTAETTDETTATTADNSANMPKTGVVGLGLLYGLGAIATGAVALKKKYK